MSEWNPGIPEEYRNSIVTGDSKLLADRIPDDSVDLVFTDPVYDNIDDYWWLAETAERILKPDSACLMWQGQQWLADTIAALAYGPLRYRWMLGWYASNNMQMVGRVGRNMVPLLWYEKGHSNPVHAVREVKEAPIPDGNTPFKWAKRLEVVSYFMMRFTKPGDVVFDPFSGLASLPAACKAHGRNYVAFEIDPERAEQGRERVRHTQDPLFVHIEEQAQMEIAP